MPLANLDDINANLDGTVVKADDDNTKLLQISVSRIVRGYLARIVDVVTLGSWTTPELTPEIVREATGKLIASQLYFQKMSTTTLSIDDSSIAQKLYDEGIALLNGIVTGTVDIIEVTETPESSLTDLDFFPVDDTDRAFTRGMEL